MKNLVCFSIGWEKFGGITRAQFPINEIWVVFDMHVVKVDVLIMACIYQIGQTKFYINNLRYKHHQSKLGEWHHFGKLTEICHFSKVLSAKSVQWCAYLLEMTLWLLYCGKLAIPPDMDLMKHTISKKVSLEKTESIVVLLKRSVEAVTYLVSSKMA